MFLELSGRSAFFEGKTTKCVLNYSTKEPDLWSSEPPAPKTTASLKQPLLGTTAHGKNGLMVRCGMPSHSVLLVEETGPRAQEAARAGEHGSCSGASPDNGINQPAVMKGRNLPENFTSPWPHTPKKEKYNENKWLSCSC